MKHVTLMLILDEIGCSSCDTTVGLIYYLKTIFYIYIFSLGIEPTYSYTLSMYAT